MHFLVLTADRFLFHRKRLGMTIWEPGERNYFYTWLAIDWSIIFSLRYHRIHIGWKAHALRGYSLAMSEY